VSLGASNSILKFVVNIVLLISSVLRPLFVMGWYSLFYWKLETFLSLVPHESPTFLPLGMSMSSVIPSILVLVAVAHWIEATYTTFAVPSMSVFSVSGRFCYLFFLFISDGPRLLLVV